MNDEEKYKNLILLLSDSKDKTMNSIGINTRMNIEWIKDYIHHINLVGITIVLATLNIVALGHSNYFKNLVLLYFGLLLLIAMIIYSAYYVTQTISVRDRNIQRYVSFIKKSHESILQMITTSMKKGESYEVFFPSFEKEFEKMGDMEKLVRGENKITVDSSLDLISILFIAGFIVIILSILVPL